MPNTARAYLPPVGTYNAATATQGAYVARYTAHNQRRHLVVPVVMMVPGVHCGSAGPILHTAEQLSRHAEAWNGIPVTVGHPMDGTTCVSANQPAIVDADVIGRVYNTYYDAATSRLRAEVWLDEALAQARHPGLVAHIVAGLPMDVSMGAFTDDTPANGSWNGEAYIAISSNHRPDHLALLPHGQGACSWTDGCGLRANSLNTYINRNDGGTPMEKSLWLALQALGMTVTPLIVPSGMQANAQGYRELIQQVQRKLDSMDSDAQYHYLEELFDDGTFVYRVSQRSDGRPDLYYRRGYTIDASGVVVFADVLTLVRRQVEYIPVPAAQGQPLANTAAEGPTAMTRTRGTNGGTLPMDNNNQTTPCACPDPVAALMANAGLGPEDRAWVDQLPPQAVARLVAAYGAPPAEAPAEAPPAPAAEAAAEEAPQRPADEAEVEAEAEAEAPAPPPTAPEPQANALTVDAYVAQAPEALRPQLAAGLALYQERRTALVQQVTAATTVYSAAELSAMETPALEKLAAAIKAPVDYSVKGGGVPPMAAPRAGGNVLLPPDVAKNAGK